MSLTKVSYSMITGETVNVLDYGADASGTTDSKAAIEAAFAAAGTSKTVWFPQGTYLISETVRLQSNYKFDGNNAIIKADTGFVGINAPSALGGTVLVKAMFMFWEGATIDNTAGNRVERAYCGGGITFDGNALAEYGIWMERMPESTINSSVKNTTLYGIRINTYCWGLYFENVNIYNIDGSGGIYLGDASNGVSFDNLRVWGQNYRPTYGVHSNGNNNGVSLTGGYLEKVEYGLYIEGESGPFAINGVDFEDTTFNNVHVLGPGGVTRRRGPVVLQGCFFESDAASIYTDGGQVIVNSCRFRTGGVTKDLFETAGYGVITEFNNVKDSPVSVPIGEVYNYYAQSAANSTTSYLAASAPTNGQTWWGAASSISSNEGGSLRFGTNLAVNKYAGVRAYHEADADQIGVHVRVRNDADPAVNAITSVIFDYNGVTKPGADNTYSLGAASYRWSVVYAGTGTINTSDARDKQQVRDLSDVERTVAARCKGLIKAFKFNDAVDLKGDGARIHFGVMAQDVAAAFATEGLDASNYGLFCSDTLPDGTTRLGIRYEELLAFVITSL